MAQRAENVGAIRTVSNWINGENYQSYRRTQFNLTLCDLPIKTLLTSQRNQIYSEASSTHFSAINLSYTYAPPIILLIDPNKSQTFQYTIRLIAEHNSI